ncbi:MAG: SDR family NAD(P)-dependent oxidoreductase [Oscillatoria sp. PMC 1068.18]|nr:SDR family NAD(P)-dependent oxidoreductase [Oscillatoria sp. PMC 1076.18]MEC4987802.1 SDR family NAD(P)-dependent oxidoreductase [Oscillatoria sp. PMC 1068.18]
MNTEIAVIGMACWYPGAKNARELWENILTKRRQFRRTPNERLPLSDYQDADPRVPDKTYCSFMALIDGFNFDWSTKRIPKPTFEATDIVHWLALELALQAFSDAGYNLQEIPSDATGVLVGNTLSGEVSRSRGLRLRWPYVAKSLRSAGESLGIAEEMVEALETVMESYYKQPFPPANQDTLAGVLSNTIAGRICNYLNLHGGGYTVDGACSSSLIALSTAAQGLANNQLDLALAGGVDISLDPFEVVGFAKTKALTTEEMSVYDLNASGFIPGEGSGFVVLKRLEDARRDGDYVYAVLKGWGISSDGAGVGITAPSGSGQALALRRAYAQAGYSPQTLDFIEGHGTGTPVGDRAELKGIALAMDNPPEKRFCGLTSLKSIIGHTKAAAGIGGFIKAAIAVNRRVLPPTAGCQEPNELFETTATALYPILQGECHPQQKRLRAGVSAMGFGGSNCHVTLESGDAPSEKLAPTLSERQLLVSSQETELFIFSADTFASLEQQITHLGTIAPQISEAELVDLAADQTQRLDQTLPIRAAVLASSAKDLTKQLQTLQGLLDSPPPPGEVKVNLLQTVWLSHQIRPCRVGFLFPGQGSQQLNMGRTLVQRYDWARELIQQADEWVNSCEVSPISSFIYRPLDRAKDKDQIREWRKELAQTQTAQPSLCLASLLWLRYLQKLGIEPVAVGGHSLGELTAFHVAGAFDAKELITLASVRGKAMSAPQETTGTMASLGCDVAKTEEILAAVGGDVVIANINSPTQTVISGAQEDVEAVVELALEESIQSRLLSVSNAFHSHFVAQAAETIHDTAPIPEQLKQTTVPLFSSMNGEEVVAGMNLHQHFCQQVTAQVNLITLVEAMSSQCDLLIEVGPGKVLSGLVSSINGREGVSCFPIESKAERDRDLNTVLGTVFVNGGNINWEYLYENRLVRPWVWSRQFIVSPCEIPFQKISVEELELPNVQSSKLASLTNLSSQEFTNYLKHRENFIAQVIKADLANLPALELAVAQKSLEGEKTKVVVEVETKVVAKQDSRQSIEEMIVEKIVEETGYSKESIPFSARLLDDLRLESIKVGEIIGFTATQFGVAGRIEPSELANSTITEVALAIRQAIRDDKGGQAIASSSIGAKETVVRNFAVQYLPEALPKETQESIQWSEANCLVICEAQETEVANQLVKVLRKKKSLTQLLSFSHAEDLSETYLGKFSHFIAILPRQGDENPDLSKIVKRLQIFNTLPAPKERHYSQATVAYLQFGGGYFGSEDSEISLNQGCAKALAATLDLERPDLKVRVLDFSPTIALADIAKSAIAELSTPESCQAVGYTPDLARRIPRPVVQELADYTPRSLSWSKDDVILVTGGAKGITAECAFTLASATGVQMALVGSSPHPDLEPGNEKVARTLERFQAQNLTCRYYQADISDLATVEAVIAQIRQELGEITGVIHGAAINRPSNLDRASVEAVLTEISPKLQGIINLTQVLEEHPPKLLVGISSIIGFTGMPRNGWYGFSNEAMELIIQNFGNRHPQTQVLTIGYSIWNEVGMGFEMGAVKHLEQMGIDAIPKEEGARRFLELIEHDPGTSRVFVTTPIRSMSASSPSDTWLPKLFPYPTASKFLQQFPSASQFAKLQKIYEPGVLVVGQTHLTVESHPYLRDHCYKGSYLFPTVFGLEAMAQAVAFLTGEQNFAGVQIKDIRLDRGITVESSQGTLIELRAQAIERQSKDEPRQVKASIRSELTGFTKDHFSATFILRPQAEVPVEEIPESELPLDIQPENDLYGGILFQGAMFQRLEKFYSITPEHCIFSARQEQPTHPSDEEWLLGDPYFRDALLQAGQAAIPQELCLPIGIDSLEIYHTAHRALSLKGMATLDNQEGKDYHATVVMTEEGGQIAEKLTGYRLRVLDHQETNPTAEELVNPDRRDERLLAEKLQEIAANFGVTTPQIGIWNQSQLQQIPLQERHEQELPLLEKTVRQLLNGKGKDSENFDIEWLESGKPRVAGEVGKNIDVSLSHDDRVCLCVCGSGSQGCDLEPLQVKTETEWIALLGNSRQSLLQELIQGNDPLEYAGMRIWTAVEALIKAQLPRKEIGLIVEKWVDEQVLFGVQNSPKKAIAFPIQLTRGKERLIAIVVE